MIVLTLDQRRSRSSPDLAEAMRRESDALAGDALLRPFQRTAGDEIQGVLEEAGAALRCVLHASRSRHWSTGVGIGPARHPLPEETRAGSGAAFERARDAVTRAKRASGDVALTAQGRSGEDAEALLQLLCELERRRSDSSQEAGELITTGLTQAAAAEELGISPQALSQRLHRGLWQETRRVMSLLGAMMTELDRD